MDETERTAIDAMPYEEMLRANRFAPAGDPRFQGERGNYFLKVMAKKRAEVGPEAHTRVSKRIGWG